MDKVTFDEILLKTAFCCMASDGNIDKREIEMIQFLCENSEQFGNFNFQQAINNLVQKINSDGHHFIKEYLNILENAELNEKEEILLLDFAIKTIQADDEIEYSEIKFFKTIRHRLTISDETILAFHPGIEDYLEEDIITPSLDKLTDHFFETLNLNNFEEIVISTEN
ncbi:hypothetical protein QGN23_00540 [Chryseobacterium gotjawalense]|uniref:TerB family tellurite resistance protein n=1 Tax=Chryseobacterium gotjawalense TaxID=3042315 RepID=A0ABY8RD45_9FLAO|nr:hypothetical protein [Chryseobacterium sp. wdc7]WHF51781.1 hypothetical protein QGN23_00540 [Chryseobacterium sp. wdc7]